MQPLHDDIHDITLLRCRQLPSLGNAMPLHRTVAATASGGMLGNERWEDAMTHGRLPAVVGNKCGSKTLGYNLAGALSDFRPTLLSDIRLVLGVQIERTAELALGKPLKKGRKVGGSLFVNTFIVFWKQVQLLIHNHVIVLLTCHN